ncbi:aromatic acid exporter family protein [Faecalimonas sp.]
MKSLDYIKTFKISIGCCIAFFIAETFSLTSPTSVITITLLSILNTKKDTFLVAGKRLFSFFIAVLTAIFIFPLLHYSLVSLGIYLALYQLLCQLLHLTEGFSMSTVLMLHLLKVKKISVPLLINELCLMLIGICMGILMNLYMPNKIKKIQKSQKEIEEKMAQILFTMSRAIFQEYLSETITENLAKLETLLSTSLSHAQYTQKNFFFKDMSYYVNYIHMRSKQTVILKQIHHNLPRLQESYLQTNLVSKFMRITAISIENYDNAEDLLKYLSLLRRKFRSAPLPSTRQEFESRAVLYEIVNELQEIIILKRIFTESLSPHEIKIFWETQK